tara:strand:+ start:66 stop:401 length:336 start_codon:yes stop_codon:yes gene_type:complete
MAIKAIEVMDAWRQGFSSGNSDPLSEMLHDDFIFIGPTNTRSKEETLHWVSNTPDLQQSESEILYENDEVFVGLHDIVRSQGQGTAKIMFFGRFEDGKVSFFRAHRQPTEI